MEHKPKLYLTCDRDGMHLWFCTWAPLPGKEGIYRHDLPGAKIRIPMSWYSGIMEIGECIEINPEQLCQPQFRRVT